MQNTRVTLTRCSDYSSPAIAEALQRQFTLLGGLQKFVKASDSVLLKPNFIAPKSRRHAVQTDPAVIIETAKLLKDFGAKPFVADSPAWSNVFTCVKKLKLQEPLRKLGVPVKQLDKPKRVQIGKAHTKLGISSIALDADVIINLPKLKTHRQLTVSFAVKNMFGTVTGKQKAYRRQKYREDYIICRKYGGSIFCARARKYWIGLILDKFGLLTFVQYKIMLSLRSNPTFDRIWTKLRL